MAHLLRLRVSTQGFLFDGKWIESGDPVEIRSPYDGSVVGRVFQGRREHAEAAIAAAVKAFGTTRRLPAFERQRVLAAGGRGITAAQRRICPHHGAGSGQADQGCADGSGARHFHLHGGGGREHSHLWRVSAARLAGIYRGTLGDCEAVSSGADRGNHSF